MHQFENQDTTTTFTNRQKKSNLPLTPHLFQVLNIMLVDGHEEGQCKREWGG